MKLLSELDSLDNVKDGSIRKLPTKTSDLTNDSGFITSSISVIDNLTSTSTTSALSANQGKVLNDNKVPNTRTVAGKALSANITLASTDLTDTANIARLTAPTNIAGTEQATTKFMTSNGGSLTIGKEGPNSGTMIRLDQVDGTARLRFRSSATAGAMVWSQLEANAALYMDLANSAGVTKRITFNALQLSHPVKLYAPTVQTTTLTNGTYNYTLPGSTGTLALTSQIPSTSNFVDLTTAQTIAGTKTFSDDLKLSKKLYIGTMQTIYNADAEGGFTGSLFFGNGGASLSHTTGSDGYYNIGIGKGTLYNNTTGAWNVAIGSNSLNANTIGFENTGIGNGSLDSNTTGLRNSAIGNGSLRANTIGDLNTAIGYFSLVNNITGDANTAIGCTAGSNITGGGVNSNPNSSIFIGSDTRALADNQTNQIVIGAGTTGHGSNTATIGNSSITDNYFTGNIHLTGTILGMYPIGAIYISVVSTSPASLFGGTWVAFGAGRVLLGMGSNGETNYTTIKATGGSENSYSSHNHGNVSTTNGYFDIGSFGTSAETLINVGGFVTRSTPGNNNKNFWSIDTGSRPLRRATLNHSHSVASTGTTGGNRMPYITVYMWERTA